MLLKLTWLIPGLPILGSIFISILLLSFTKTMNRLTKPVSYFLIICLGLSEIINFILFKNNISGHNALFGSDYELFVDRASLLFAESIGSIFLLVMLFSVAKLQRRNGYVRYFISLGFLIGFVYTISFSGSLFHTFYDPLISSLENIGISL